MNKTPYTQLSTDIDFERDGKQCGFLRLPHSVHRSAYGWLPIPIVCIKNGKGPRVLLVSGNHGDEYEGQVALNRLIRTLEPKDVRGRIVILPAANFPAAMAGMRTSPIDQGNLNRSFPGDPDGSVTEKIAHYIEAILLPQAEYVLDLHSGGSSLQYIPSALMRRPDKGDKKGARMLELLKGFGAPMVYVVDAPQGGDRTLTGGAHRTGIHHMGTELGGIGAVSRDALAVAERGVRRYLAMVGALAKPPKLDKLPPSRFLEVRGPDYYVYAPDSGVFEPLVELGDEVKKGQPAAIVHFTDTPWREPSKAHFQRAGVVVCKRIPARCERGDCLFHLGTDAR